MFTKLKTALTVGSLSLVPALVSAQAFDGTTAAATATASLDEVGVAVALIGGAMIAAIVAGIAYRWVVAYLAK